MKKLLPYLYKPTDARLLAIFRICLGLVMAWQMWCFIYLFDVAAYLNDSALNFTYYYLWFLKPLGLSSFYCLNYFLLLLAICLAAGFLYHITTPLLCIGFAYIFFLDKSYYNNHYYLMVLLLFLMSFVQANARWSIDNIIFPKTKRLFITKWQIYILRFQVVITFFFSGLAKVNSDWLNGYPLKLTIENRGVPELLQGIFSSTNAFAMFLSYSGLLFDLSIAFLLFNKSTKFVAIVLLILFNLSNHIIFEQANMGRIGVFPFLIIGALVLFLEAKEVSFLWKPAKLSKKPVLKPTFIQQKMLAGALIAYVTIQLLLPIYHYILPGNTDWTTQGRYFAWRMKQVNKEISEVNFNLPQLDYDCLGICLKNINSKQALSMGKHPEMILDFAHYMQAYAKQRGDKIDNITCTFKVAFNGRNPQLLVKPTQNLLTAKYHPLQTNTWIMPLKNNN